MAFCLSTCLCGYAWMIWAEETDHLASLKQQWQEDQSRRIAWKRLQPLQDSFKRSPIHYEEMSSYISKKMQKWGGNITSLTLSHPVKVPHAPQWEKRTVILEAQAPSDTIFYQWIHDVLTATPGVVSMDLCHLRRQKTADEKLIISGRIRFHWIYRKISNKREP